MKPILFNTEMVRAILEGRKTVTRRAVKPQPKAALFPMPDSMCWPGCFANAEEPMVYRPPYKSGDTLWVRETFRVDYLSNIPGAGRVQYKDGTYMDIRFAPERYDMMRRAQRKPGWRPNENMPSEAARLFLRVKEVSVEKLREISALSAMDEGVTDWNDFVRLWNTTIKSADLPLYGWDANPWVWVIEFERIGKDEAIGGGGDG